MVSVWYVLRRWAGSPAGALISEKGGRVLKASIVTIGVALLIVLILPAAVSAQETKPIQLSLFNPVQIYDEDTSITGVRFNLVYGVNQDVTGLDFGIIQRSKGDVKGLQFGFVSLTEGAFTGWQDHLANVTHGYMTGLQTGIFNSAVGGKGVQFGAIAINEGKFEGLMFSVFNMTEDMYGVQIGLINIISSKAKLKFLPIVNWKFDK